MTPARNQYATLPESIRIGDVVLALAEPLPADAFEPGWGAISIRGRLDLLVVEAPGERLRWLLGEPGRKPPVLPVFFGETRAFAVVATVRTTPMVDPCGLWGVEIRLVELAPPTRPGGWTVPEVLAHEAVAEGLQGLAEGLRAIGRGAERSAAEDADPFIAWLARQPVGRPLTAKERERAEMAKARDRRTVPAVSTDDLVRRARAVEAAKEADPGITWYEAYRIAGGDDAEECPRCVTVADGTRYFCDAHRRHPEPKTSPGGASDGTPGPDYGTGDGETLW